MYRYRYSDLYRYRYLFQIRDLIEALSWFWWYFKVEFGPGRKIRIRIRTIFYACILIDDWHFDHCVRITDQADSPKRFLNEFLLSLGLFFGYKRQGSVNRSIFFADIWGPGLPPHQRPHAAQEYRPRVHPHQPARSLEDCGIRLLPG